MELGQQQEAIKMRKDEKKSEKRKEIVLVQQQKNQQKNTESKRGGSEFQLKIQIFGLRSFKRSLLPFRSVVPNSDSLDRVVVLSDSVTWPRRQA